MLEQNHPQISIIMPVYNSEQFVAGSIESVLAQQFTSWELIIIDDGSTDNSGQICDSFSLKDSRVKVFHINNGGVSNARNYGIQQANGEYIQFLDSDDYLVPETLQTAYTQKGDSDLLIWGYERFPRKVIKCADSVRHYMNHEEFAEAFLLLMENNLFAIPWNKLYRRGLIIENNVCFQKGLSLGEDHLFNLAYLKVCTKIKVIPEILHRYRYGENDSLSAKFRANYMEIQQRLKEETDRTFHHAEAVVLLTGRNYTNDTINYIMVCIRKSNLSELQKIRKIRRCLHNEFFTANLKKEDLDVMQIRELTKLLILGKHAYLLYIFCTGKKILDQCLEKIRKQNCL